MDRGRAGHTRDPQTRDTYTSRGALAGPGIDRGRAGRTHPEDDGLAGGIDALLARHQLTVQDVHVGAHGVQLLSVARLQRLGLPRPRRQLTQRVLVG